MTTKLGEAGMSRSRTSTRSVVIEKPFGRDAASARELDAVVRSAFRERQVFRIDHYLGKETVQNILVLRFANGIFEPVWNRNFIDHVQITVAESLGVEGRGRFYEEAGAMRDIVQNHLLQVLSFVAMEPPGSFDVESVRNERAKVLATLRQLGTADVVRGQYDAGFSGGNAVPAYRDEEGVDPNSLTETYVAARLAVDNWRWAEVPFYVRTGKRLAKRVSEVAIQFKRVPHLPFSYAAAEQLEPNVLVLRIQPNEGIALRFGAKVPSTRTQIRTVNMDFDYDTAFATAPAEAYETLLVDALRGDATNFIRIDAVTDAWRVVDPVHPRLAERGRRSAPLRGGQLGARRRRRSAGARRAQVAPAVSAIAARRGTARRAARRRARRGAHAAARPRRPDRRAARGRAHGAPARGAAGQPAVAGDHRARRARQAGAGGERRGRDDAHRRAATASCAASSCTSPPATRARPCRA